MRLWAAIFLAGLLQGAAGIPPREARKVFEEAQSACKAEGGRLWGQSLCGPWLLVEPQSKTVVGSEADGQGLLSEAEGVYVGTLPPKLGIANTALTWAGKEWSELIWPLPDEATARRVLLMHEAFHRLQPKLGWKGKEASNAHLDSEQGRVLLQLEWRALRQALTSSGVARKQSVADALSFRAERRRQFPEAEEQERSLEGNEGLAEYTGVVAGSGEAVSAAVKDLEQAAAKKSFVRSFAYGSGPAYGLLLDQSGMAWRPRAIKGEDLGKLLAEAYRVQVPAEVGQRAEQYGGAELRAWEKQRAEAQRRVAQEYRAKLVDGPVVVIPLQSMQVEFNPNELVPLAPHGTVYPTLRIRDVWGELRVNKGALLSTDWKQVTVPAPLEGDGWTLTLQPGWAVQDGRLVRK